ncbi:MAG: hypothetical protein FWF81_08650 [Defluviitaleaceae bacterium]|nr:hypothetical protein [Defluviitaleaceae bacterium]
MVHINLIPHEGVEINNIGKVYIGQTLGEVEAILGEVFEDRDRRYFYDD